MKTLQCKTCGEEVPVPDRQVSVLCQDCAEQDMAERELQEEPEAKRDEIRAALADPGFRKGYLHHRALEKARER